MKVESVINGVYSFAEKELIPALDGMRKWRAEFGLGFIRSQAGFLINEVVSNPYVSMLRVVDSNGDVNVDALLEAAKNATKKHGKLNINIPMIGEFNLGEDAFDLLGDYIESAK